MKENNEGNISGVRSIAFIAVVLFIMALSPISDIFSALVSLMKPVLLGLFLAVLISVPLKFFEQKVFTRGSAFLRRSISLSATFLVTLMIVTVLLFIIIPQLSQAAKEVVERLPALLQGLSNRVDTLRTALPDWLAGVDLDFQSIEAEVLGFVQSSAKKVVGSSLSIVQYTLSSVLTVLLSIVFALYILAKKEVMINQLKDLLKAFSSDEVYRKLIHGGTVSTHTMQAFIATMAVEALILGGLFLVTMLIFSFPYPFLVASIVAVSAFIPIVGAFLAALIGALLMVVSDPIQALYFLILFLVLQQLEGNIIYPKVVGDSIGLPAFWVLFAVIVGGNLFGVLGMFVGVPAVAVIYALVQESVKARLESRQ